VVPIFSDLSSIKTLSFSGHTQLGGNKKTDSTGIWKANAGTSLSVVPTPGDF
jgi:hypothetical protein